MPHKILYSPGYGAGWQTWNTDYSEDFLFDAELIEAVESGVPLGSVDEPGTPLHSFVQRLIAKHGPDAEHVYLGGACDLRVGTVDGPFTIEEYDGSEAILQRSDDVWFTPPSEREGS